MDITLKPELERYVEEQVRTGRFSSQAEVLEAGLARLMFEPDLAPDYEDFVAIEEAEKEIAEGRGLNWSVVSSELRNELLGE